MSKEEILAYKRAWYHKNRDRLREKQAAYKRQWRIDNPEKAKELDKEKHNKYREYRNAYTKEYYEIHKNDENFKNKRNERSLRYYYNNTDKAAARTAVTKAVLRGKITKPLVCENCSDIKPLEGHHTDYSKKLEVAWLCKGCHETTHHQALSDVRKELGL